MTALNNASMKTVVETFIIEETQELIYDNDKLDQWNKRVAELGLTGQTKIVAPEKSPIPFLHMKAPLVRVFETLCPRKVSISEYDKTPIPVEILDLVALSKKEQYFTGIQIWYDDETPDPVCVGLVEEYYTYSAGYNRIQSYKSKGEAEAAKLADSKVKDFSTNLLATYLIGRWADVKASLEELTARAKKVFIANSLNEYSLKIKKFQRYIDDLELEANKRFGYTEGNPDSLFGMEF